MSSGADQSFPKRLRLRKRRHFLTVQRRGRRVGTRHFVVCARPNRGRPTRMGVTVSKKVGKAYVRNRVKRLVREAFRRNRQVIAPGLDVVFVARAAMPIDNYGQCVDEVLSALGRLAAGEGGKGTRRRRRPSK